MALLDSKQSLILVDSATTPAAADFLETTDVVVINPTPQVGSYQRITGKKNSKSSYVDENHSLVTFTISTFMRGNDTTGAALETVPKHSHLLQMCGLTETIDTSVSDQEFVEYEPSQGIITGGYVTAYTDGYKRAITGALGNLSIDFIVGEPVKMTAEMMAYVSSLGATAEANPTVTLDTNTLLMCTKITVLTVGGSTFNAKSGSLKMNHQLEDIYAVGLGEYESADFAPQLELSGFKTAGDESAWTDLTARTTRQIIITFGATNGKAARITIDGAVVATVEESTDQDKIASKIVYDCERVDGTNEAFKIRYGYVV